MCRVLVRIDAVELQLRAQRGSGRLEILRPPVIASILALVLLGTPAVASDPSANPKPHAVFLIQTGAFKSDEKAREHCDPLTAAGFPLQVVKKEPSQRSVWFICRSVDAVERDHANKIVDSLKSDAGVSEVLLVPVSAKAAKSTSAPSKIPNDLRADFEKFMSQREA
jgi:hypothetical protein